MTRIASLTAVAAVVCLGTLPLLSSCEVVECGSGTIEENGSCVPADQVAVDGQCGPGTVFDGTTQECIPRQSAEEICGAGTNLEVLPDGSFQCIGDGSGGSGCGAPIGCPAPSSGKVTVCGQLFDTETGQPLAGAATGAVCNETTADGPCSLQLNFYDPLAFAADPVNTAPQANDGIVVDDCGRFRGESIVRPFNGFLAVATEDANDIAAPAFVRTGVAMAVAANEKRTGQPGYATHIATDEMWTQTAGLSGATFSERGVYAPIFYDGFDHDTPVAGVTITVGGATSAANDYYYSDTDPTVRSSADGGDSTGVNGSGLMLGSALTQHSGTGSERAGCEWTSDLGASIPGVVFVQLKYLVVEGTTDQACP